MLNQDVFNTLNIQGKNTLKDDTLYSLSNNYIPTESSNEISNFIMNSNLEFNNTIK